MADTKQGLPSLTLAGAFYRLMLASAACVLLGVLWFINVYSARLLDTTLETAVRTRTTAASETIARMLHADWTDLKFLAGEIAESGDRRVGGLMDGMRGDGSRIAWIGMADTDGTILKASHGVIEGADATERPWFRNGLKGPFAGDVHDAVLLARVLDSGGENPARLIDLALPVTGAGGETLGVVVAHINFDWVVTVVNEIAQSARMELFLLSADGSVVLATTEEAPSAEEIQILSVARTGVATAGREIWPDGREYFSTIMPSVQYQDLPNFGWRLVGRIHADAFRPDLETARATALWTIVAVVAILVILTATFIMVFLRPIGAIAATADRIADGEDIYPPDQNRTREAALLSSAVARLQSDTASGRFIPPGG